MAFIKVLLFFIALQSICIVKCKPLLGGITFRKEYDIGFKPILIRPIALIKEKWSPFGIFGTRHGIAKRSLEDSNEIATQTPNIDENLSRLPDEIAENLETSMSQFYPEAFPLDANIIIPSEREPFTPIITPGFHNNLHTDISKADNVKKYLESVDRLNPVDRPVEEINSVESDEQNSQSSSLNINDASNPILKGSKLALSLGNVILQIIAQFVTNAGPTINQLFNRSV